MIDYKSLYAPKDFVNGWNEEIKTSDYHIDKTAVNSSSLKMMLKSPLAFHNSFYGESKEPTEAMKFGTIAHLAILQGDEFLSRYIVMPEFESKTADGKPSDSKNTKYYKEQVEAWRLGLKPDSVIVTQKELDKLLGMVNSIKKHKLAMRLLSNGKAEIAGYWVDPVTGLKCRMQDDFLSFNLGALVDLKTTTDCEWNEFRKSVERLNYPFQIGMYAEGIKQITGSYPKKCFWVAIENEAPYDVAIYEVDEVYMQIGLLQFRDAMNKLKVCVDSGRFEGLQADGTIEITEPSFHFKEKNKHLLGDI